MKNTKKARAQKQINEVVFEHDSKLIEDQENGAGKKPHTTAYVPTNNSGATIATGFDLSRHNNYDLKNMDIDFDEIGISKENEAIIYALMNKDMVGDTAKKYLKINPLQITEQQANYIDTKVYNYHKTKAKEEYEKCTGNKFQDLTKIQKTVLFSIHMNTGNVKYFAKGEFLKNFKPSQKCFQKSIDILLSYQSSTKGIQIRRRFEGKCLQEEYQQQQQQSVLKQTYLEYLTKVKQIIINLEQYSKKTKNQQEKENLKQIQNQQEIESIKNLLQESLQQFNQVFFSQNNLYQINQSLETLKNNLNQKCQQLLKEQLNIDLRSENCLINNSSIDLKKAQYNEQSQQLEQYPCQSSINQLITPKSEFSERNINKYQSVNEQQQENESDNLRLQKNNENSLSVSELSSPLSSSSSQSSPPLLSSLEQQYSNHDLNKNKLNNGQESNEKKKDNFKEQKNYQENDKFKEQNNEEQKEENDNYEEKKDYQTNNFITIKEGSDQYYQFNQSMKLLDLISTITNFISNKEQKNYQEKDKFKEQDNEEEQKEVNDNDEEQKEDQTNNYKTIREKSDQYDQSSQSMKLLDLISTITKFIANNYTILEELNEIESEMQEYEKDELQSCKKDDLYDQYKLKYQNSNPITIQQENEFRKMLNLINEIEKQGSFDSSIFFKVLLKKKNQSKTNIEIVIKTQSQQELIDLLNIQPLSNNKLDPIKDRSQIQKNKDLFEQIMNLKGFSSFAIDNLNQYIIDGCILYQQQLIKSLKNLDNLQIIFEKKILQIKSNRELKEIIKFNKENKEDLQNLITTILNQVFNPQLVFNYLIIQFHKHIKQIKLNKDNKDKSQIIKVFAWCRIRLEKLYGFLLQIQNIFIDINEHFQKLTGCNLIKISYCNQQVIGDDDKPSFLNFNINDKNEDLNDSSLIKFQNSNKFSLNETNKNNTEFSILNLGIQSNQVIDQQNISNKSSNIVQAQAQYNKIVNQENKKNKQYSFINYNQSNNEINNQTNKQNFNASAFNTNNSQTDSKNCKNYFNMNLTGVQNGQSSTYSINSKNMFNLNGAGLDDSQSYNVSIGGFDTFNISITAKSTQKPSFNISFKPQFFNFSFGDNLNAFTFNPLSLFNFSFGGSGSGSGSSGGSGGGASSKSEKQGKYGESQSQQQNNISSGQQYEASNGNQYYDFQPLNQIYDFKGGEGNTKRSQNNQGNQSKNKIQNHNNQNNIPSQSQYQGSGGNQNQDFQQLNQKYDFKEGEENTQRSQNKQGNQGDNDPIYNNNQNIISSQSQYQGSSGNQYQDFQQLNYKYDFKRREESIKRSQNQQGNQDLNKIQNDNTSDYQCQKSSKAQYQYELNSEQLQLGQSQLKYGQYQQGNALESINSFGNDKNMYFQPLNNSNNSARIVKSFDEQEKSNNYHEMKSQNQQQESSKQDTQSIRNEISSKNFLNLSQIQDHNCQNQNQNYNNPQVQESIRSKQNQQNSKTFFNKELSEQYYNQINKAQSNQQGQFKNISQQQNPYPKKHEIINQFSNDIFNGDFKNYNNQNNFQKNDSQYQNQYKTQKIFYQQAISFLKDSLSSYQDLFSNNNLKKISQLSQETKNTKSKEQNQIENELNTLEETLMKQIEENIEDQIKEINDESENKNGQKNDQKNDQKKEKDDKKCSCNRRIIIKDSSGRTSFKDGCSCKDKEEKIKKVSGNIFSFNS